MIRRDTFINKIRELKYSYKDTQKRTYLYRQKGTTNYIAVPMCELLEDEYVAQVLRQNHVKDTDIKAFIAQYSQAPAQN